MKTTWLINNSTKWSTSDLKKIFAEAKRRVDKKERTSIRHLNICIKNSSWGISGHAYIGTRFSYSGEMTLCISRQINEFTNEIKRQFAQVFTHEYYHCIGARGIDHKNYKSDFTKHLDYSWVDKYEISKKVNKPKKSLDLKEKRKQAAIRNLKLAETRFKRAKTLRDKWSKKVKYYTNDSKAN